MGLVKSRGRHRCTVTALVFVGTAAALGGPLVAGSQSTPAAVTAGASAGSPPSATGPLELVSHNHNPMRQWLRSFHPSGGTPKPTTTSSDPPSTTTSSSTTTSTTDPPPTTTSAPPTTAGPVQGSAAVPARGQDFQYQLANPPTTSDLTLNVAWWDIDGFDTPASTIATIHAKSEHAICYIDVGGAENWRSDYSKFPPSVLGNTIPGWPNERYVDIRQLSVLSPIEGARFDTCKSKGFDAVDPDVLDAFTKPSGFPLTQQDQINFNNMIAGLAHARGLSIALKGDPELAVQEVSTFDFSIDEECYQWSECNRLSPFITAGKAVFDVEYDIAPSSFCPTTTALGIVGIEKHSMADFWRATCP
jgi:hypothetical protein